VALKALAPNDDAAQDLGVDVYVDGACSEHQARRESASPYAYRRTDAVGAGRYRVGMFAGRGLEPAAEEHPESTWPVEEAPADSGTTPRAPPSQSRVAVRRAEDARPQWRTTTSSLRRETALRGAARATTGAPFGCVGGFGPVPPVCPRISARPTVRPYLLKLLGILVARDGIEPPTLRFSVACSTN
jgi:hypothetical protein